jgi:hypothetical protein
MVELSLLLAGVFALPWYVLGILVIVFLCDVGAASKDEFAFATGAIIVGLLLVSGLGWWTEGFNPLGWAWNHPVDVNRLRGLHADRMSMERRQVEALSPQVVQARRGLFRAGDGSASEPTLE